MGRTPVIAPTIRDFLCHQLLNYLEAVIRVYNRWGRRDNLYKARIKILVKAEGQRFIDEVEAEYRRIVEQDGAAHHPRRPNWPAWQASFVEPAIDQATPAAEPVTPTRHPTTSAGCSATCSRTATRPCARSCCRSSVWASRPATPTADQLDAAGPAGRCLQRRRGARDARPEPAAALGARRPAARRLARGASPGPGQANVGLLTDMIACPGGDFCDLANALAAAGRRDHRAPPGPRRGWKTWARSTCHQRLHRPARPPQRPHRHPGRGQGRRGGTRSRWAARTARPERSGHAGQVIGPSFAHGEVPDVIEAILDTYVAQRQGGETFLATYQRVGAEPSRAPPTPSVATARRMIASRPDGTMETADRTRAPAADSAQACWPWAADTDVQTLDLAWPQRIDLTFPKFAGRRAFSQAFELRRRLGFAGVVRATGDVLVDQLVQKGAAAFPARRQALRADQDRAVGERLLRISAVSTRATRPTCVRISPGRPETPGGQHHERSLRPSRASCPPPSCTPKALGRLRRAGWRSRKRCSSAPRCQFQPRHTGLQPGRRGRGDHHLINAGPADIPVFVLETGRLHAETLALLRAHRGTARPGPGLPPRREAVISSCAQGPGRDLPEHRAAQGMLQHPQDGAAGARPGRQEGLDHRPAPRAVRARASRRADRRPQRARVKFNPLADWTWGDVWHYIASTVVTTNRCTTGSSQHRLRPAHRAISLGRGDPRRPLVVGGRGRQMRPVRQEVKSPPPGPSHQTRP